MYKEYEMPFWLKPVLNLEEAAAYTGIGVKKLREITNEDDCDFVLFINTKRMIKREGLDKYLASVALL